MAGTAELLRARDGDTLARPPRGHLARRHDRPRAWPRSSAAACARRSRDAMDDVVGMTVLAATSRNEIADFLAALFCVYTLLIVRVDRGQSLVFSLGRAHAVLAGAQRGARLPARDGRAVPAHLPPRSPLRIGPLDLSPIVAILVLQIVRRHRRRPDRPGDAGRPGGGRRAGRRVVAPTRPPRRSCATPIERGRGGDVVLGLDARQRAQPRRRVRPVRRRRRPARDLRARRPGRAARLLRPPPRPPARVAADRPAARRRARQPDRPRRATARSPTSSSSRCGRPSTSPTSPSPSACSRWSTCSRDRRAMDGDELVVGPEAAGERLDVFLAAHAGSRAAAAAADRRRPRARSTARRAPSATRSPRGSA